VAFLEKQFWENLRSALGIQEPLDFEFGSQGEDMKRINARLAEIFLTKSRDEWFELLKSKGTLVSPVYAFDEVPNDPHLRHRQMFLELDHPKFKGVKQVGFPLKLSGTPGRFRNFAPLLGEDTHEILVNLKYSKDEIAKLRAIGAVR
jgi:crotonobetainyl-CoA:carnitine CoA-transferase CaiB-like acyl-CoA transferase